MKRIVLGCVLACIAAASCRKETQNNPDPKALNSVFREGGSSNDQPMLLGQQLPNPYTVSNMTTAFENVRSRFPNVQSPVRVTHYYTKINVKDDVEMASLKRDSLIVFYPFPLDYAVKENGSFYRFEEGQCDSCVTAQFASLKVDQSLPTGIASERLASLYIPEEDGRLSQYINTEETGEFEEALTAEAFRLVGLPVGTNPGANFKSTGSKWRPAGRIRVWDDILSTFVPIEGVEVRARRWFTTHRGLTNSNGDYSCDGEFCEDANYSLQWDRKHFSVRSGTWGQAINNGPQKRGNWDLNLNSNPQMFYARVFRAAYQFYYQNVDGLTRPPENNNIFDVQMKIGAYNEDTDETNGNFGAWRRTFGLNCQVKIYNPNRTISAIHGTLTHELGHAAHWKMCSPKSNYNDANDTLKDSWARGVQFVLTRKFYSTYQPQYFTEYTGVVQDLLDGIGGYDQVSGYSIVEIEQAVKNKKKWNDWRDNIKNMYNNATEGNVDALFDYWN